MGPLTPGRNPANGILTAWALPHDLRYCYEVEDLWLRIIGCNSALASWIVILISWQLQILWFELWFLIELCPWWDRNGFGFESRGKPSPSGGHPSAISWQSPAHVEWKPTDSNQTNFFAECFCVAPFVSGIDSNLAGHGIREPLWPSISHPTTFSFRSDELGAASPHAQRCTSIWKLESKPSRGSNLFLPPAQSRNLWGRSHSQKRGWSHLLRHLQEGYHQPSQLKTLWNI